MKLFLATKQEFFFIKVAPVQKHNCIIGFMINTALLNVYYILRYHLFLRKEIYFFECYISLNTIFECLYMTFDWESGHQSSTFATFLSYSVLFYL